MDTMYQRGKIQDESLYYEHKKHDGSLPLVGVNTFLPKEHAGDIVTAIELIRSTPEEKAQQIDNVHNFQAVRNAIAPAGETRSEEHTSELQSLMRISYAVFCLKKKNKHQTKATYKSRQKTKQHR